MFSHQADFLSNCSTLAILRLLSAIYKSPEILNVVYFAEQLLELVLFEDQNFVHVVCVALVVFYNSLVLSQI